MTKLTHGKTGDGLTLFAGLTLPLVLAPFNLWAFAPLPLLACILLLNRQTVRRARWRSFLFGFGLFGSGASWVYVSIHDFGYTSVPFAAFITALFAAGLALVFMLPLWAWLKWLQQRPLGVLLGFPACWVLGEWSRSWLLTGFPWLFLGYSQTTTWAGGWAPLTGVYGISFLIALLAASAAHGYLHRPATATRWLPVCVAVLLFGGGRWLDTLSWTSSTGKTQHAILIQGNVKQEEKWRPEQREAIRTLYRQMSDPFWQPGQLIVWPEAAIPEIYTAGHPFFAVIRTIAENRGGALITGVPSMHRRPDGEAIYHNSLLGIGEAQGFYHKQRLVPFGEYVPLQDWLEGLLDFFHLPVSDFRTGEPDQAGLNTGQLLAAPSICYEIAYPDLVARQSRNADFLLTVSNDSWFGHSIGPHQHLQMAQMRARENGRELVRATSNGISAFIDEHGQLVSRSPQFEAVTLAGDIHARRGETPYQRLGNWPVLILCTLALLMAWRRRV